MHKSDIIDICVQTGIITHGQEPKCESAFNKSHFNDDKVKEIVFVEFLETLCNIADIVIDSK